MNTLSLFLTIPYLMVVTECCMRMVPPDDVYIPSTLAPVESTMAPEVSTMTPEGLSTSAETEAPEVTMMTTPAMETSTVTEQLCKISAATCPDLASVVIDNVDMTTDTGGCIELSCVPGNVPFLGASFDNSEIPPPTAGDVGDDFIIIAPIPPQVVVGGLNGYYGLVCENNKLKATKYPLGITTFSGSGTHGADGSFSGKKSALNQLTCD
ncbi:DUF281 domain-containing protein [Caenorhabditis elegans]|uniref:DUF281 domain-containing protein n=1 Tax=Caenorhabditis elegans TaxID=6239 RepID=M1ZJ36_CAEEL|nr:DUF281 domain-containing protein [Caenorhabditis elegans]CCU83322.1 DUF281 domain-containing protein [Caenorhabditis elegans]|eukprot:NP_001294844.1 Uncharacterized protein CELE_T14G12.12 [Caenorhabditis elegans]